MRRGIVPGDGPMQACRPANPSRTKIIFERTIRLALSLPSPARLAQHGAIPARRQFGFAASAEAGALAGATASGAAGFGTPPVNRSSTERTASRVLRSFTASSSGAEAGERRIRLSGSGKISGSSHGPCTTNGSSNPAAPDGADLRLATPFKSYSRAGTEAVPV